ncbi:MAG: AarF/ABC1/UbiB kinase family protein [Fibrobacteres bacterium]|nr:AarF/ABC1/UbiB kinase family protein [Fibrobacterota bacterium]
MNEKPLKEPGPGEKPRPLPKHKSMPLSKLARAGVAGRLAVSSALRTMRPGKSSPEEEWTRRGEAFFAACARLKGLPLKLAQMLSQEEELLPEEFRKELSRSCYQSPPMNRALVRQTIAANLGGTPEGLFKSFSETPFAAASLGQVHLAETHEGRMIALKLQYPGIARTVKNDLSLVGGFASALPWLKEVQGAWSEVAERMLEELSYGHEARWTEWFRENLGIAGVTVPSVHSAFSTETVLATDFMDGRHLQEWLAANPSQEERDALAGVLWSIYLKSVYVLNALNADPNPGNFLIRSDPSRPDRMRRDGGVAMLDFGCVKSFPPSFSGNLRKLFAMHATGFRGTGSAHSLVEEYADIGILRITDPRGDFSDLEKHLRSMGEWVLRPYRVPTFDFGSAGDYFQECRAEAWRLFRNVKGIEFAPDFVFLDRARYGLYRTFQKLGARVAMGNQWEGGTGRG